MVRSQREVVVTYPDLWFEPSKMAIFPWIFHQPQKREFEVSKVGELQSGLHAFDLGMI